MTVPLCAARLLAPFVPLFLLASAAPAAPTAAPAPLVDTAAKADKATPWLYRGSDVPHDPEWQFGELPNGVRYAVRRNGVPPGQVSIRIRMDVGSLYERPEESGYAHLLEHLVFRESKYLGPGQAIPTWQRLGATFGTDTNAETTPTQTVFKIDLPNATPATLDQSFKLLSGMMIAPTLSEADIRTELPIVLAEKRERGGTAERVQDAMRETFYAGQPLADHPPIGTVEALNAAHQDTVRAFHARWYRPENAVIIAVGDVEPAQLAGLISKYFGDWPTTGAPGKLPSFGEPAAPAGGDTTNPIGLTRVLVEPSMPRNLSFAVVRPWHEKQDTIVYNQGLMIDSVAQALINRRLEARARAGGSYLAAQVSQENVSRSVDTTFVTITPLTDDWRAAVRDVRAVIADALAKPPTPEEIAREAAEIRVAFQSGVEQRALLPGNKVADDLVQAVDIHETVASPETVQQIFEKSVPLLTPQAVLEHTRKLFTGTVERALYVTPTGDATAETLRAALLQPVKAGGNVRLAARTVSFAQLPPIGNPGQIVTDAPTGLLGIEQVNFANGVKALIWPTKDEPGRVSVKVRFGGGYRAFAPGDAPYASLADTALVGSGVATLGQEELDRISTGRKMGFDFKIYDANFEFSAETRPADLDDQLYLFAAKFAMPRWDPNPFIRAKAAARLQYDSLAASPQGVLQRDLKFYQRGSDPRYHTPTPAELQAATPAQFRKVWEPILASGPIEVQVYGDFDRDKTIATLKRTFGALAPRPPLAPTALAHTVATPSTGGPPLVLTHRGDPTSAAAVVSWSTGGGMVGVRESRQLEILAQLFSNRLLDAMREKLGASYAPQVYSEWPLDLANGGAIVAMAQLTPQAVPSFFAAADQIAADLMARPPSADELARVTEPLRQQVTRASTSTAFFMYQVQGATQDPSKFAAVRTLLGDYTQTTPQHMQELARRYLVKDRSWRVAIIPEGQKLATAVTPIPGLEPQPQAR
ncbi:MAG: insulinase family protein [Novosphingobium sp.]|nr:insulinase family protein [Novosphingobium sp.]